MIFQDMKEQCLIKGSGGSKWELVLDVVQGTKFNIKMLSTKGKRETHWLYKFHAVSFSILQESLLAGVLHFQLFTLVSFRVCNPQQMLHAYPSSVSPGPLSSMELVFPEYIPCVRLSAKCSMISSMQKHSDSCILLTPQLESRLTQMFGFLGLVRAPPAESPVQTSLPPLRALLHHLPAGNTLVYAHIPSSCPPQTLLRCVSAVRLKMPCECGPVLSPEL